MKSVEKLISTASQGVRYIEYLDDNGIKIRIDIYSDSYRHQGHCFLEVMDKDKLQWNKIAFKPAGGMKTRPGLNSIMDSKTHDFTPDFAEDRKWLLTIYNHLTS